LKDRARGDFLGMVHTNVRFLIATIDVQKNRFVVQVHGVGENKDVHIVDRFDIRKSRRLDEDGERLWVKPGSHPEDWTLLASEVMNKTYPLADGSGRHMAIKLTLCDSGVDLPLAACDVALVTSGTATLETALYGRPMVVAYRLSPTTLALVRSLNLIRVENFALPNLLTGRTLVPEFLQEEAVAERMGPALAAWLDEPERRAEAEREFARIHTELARGADGLAAQAVLEMVPGAGCDQ